MNFHALYFIGRQLVGEASIIAPSRPHGQAYFCHTCGEIWARIVVDQGDYFAINLCPCAKHRNTCVADWGATPGSLLRTIAGRRDLSVMNWAYAIDLLPESVLRYEALNAIDQFERNENAGTL